MMDIESWLVSQGLAQYAEAFVENDITVDLLPELTDADLRELGVASLGHRKRLLKAIAALNAAAASAAPAAPAPTPTEARPTTSLDEGERRHATVMFSDLTGYTALNEAFDPEEVEQIMARIKREANETIEKHGGRVNQFVGDEVMALFGVPVSRRDEAERAVRAALELHERVNVIAAGLADRLGRRLSMHTGIQSGLVVARRSDSRAGDYTLTGDAVNTAARLRGLAEPGEVVVSSQVWQQVSEAFDAEAGESVEVKGKEHALVPWRITSERTMPRGGRRELVGRVDEVRQFEALAQTCAVEGRGRVLFVRGDPGIGKSRLVAELVQIAREHGLLCHLTSVLDFGARTGPAAIQALVQSILGLDADADEGSRAEAIAEVATEGEAGAEIAPFLYNLLSVTPPPEVQALLSAMDGQTRAKGRCDALRHVARPRPKSPTLLLVEDVNWAEPATLRQLATLAALAAAHPMLVMMTTRFAGDPSVGEWRSNLHGLPVSSLNLGPLPPDDALRLAGASASMSEAMLRTCVERAEGNPLFLEQLVLSASEDHASHLPGSVQALIQARMDRLDVSERAALQAAAVWGPRVPREAIRYLVGDPSWDERVLVEHFLMRLEGDELVFSHALIRDGAYGALLLAKRRALHQRVAEWVQGQNVALAAQHYERAGDSRAPGAYLRAAEALAEMLRHEEGLAQVERGLALAAPGAETFALQRLRARLLLETGRAADSVDAARRAVDAATTNAERASGLVAIAAALRILDRPEEGLDRLAEAQPLLDGASPELSRLFGLRGNLNFVLGRWEQCEDAHENALRTAREAGSIEAEILALSGVGDAAFGRGRIRTAHEHFIQCKERAGEHALYRIETTSEVMSGWTWFFQMNIHQSLESTAAGIERARKLRLARTELLAHMQRALLHGWVRGDVAAGREELALALENRERTRVPPIPRHEPRLQRVAVYQGGRRRRGASPRPTGPRDER